MPLPLRRRTVLLSAAAMLAAPSLQGAAKAAAPAGERLNADKLGGVIDLVDALVETGKIAGGAVRVALHGETLLEHHAGYADSANARKIAPDTIYRVYSMTKPIAVAAVMALVDDGALRLDDPVAAHVPEFADLRVYVGEEGGAIRTEPARAMRVIDLLTHTSGLSNSWNPGPIAPLYREVGLNSGRYMHDPSVEGLADVAARMASVPLQFQPGTKWLYSFSPDVAGLVVERASGKSFGAFLKARIFAPLGMADTDFHAPPDKAARLASLYAPKDGRLIRIEDGAASPFLTPPSVESGAAGLVSTLSDYGRFASMLAGLGTLGEARVLSEMNARAMMSSHVPPEILGDALSRFMAFGAGGAGGGMAAALGGAVLVDPSQSKTPGREGDYTWGGAASTTFFAAPSIGLDAVLMTQLLPSGTLPLLDALKTAVYAAFE